MIELIIGFVLATIAIVAWFMMRQGKTSNEEKEQKEQR
jgi:hypothetical protein